MERLAHTDVARFRLLAVGVAATLLLGACSASGAAPVALSMPPPSPYVSRKAEDVLLQLHADHVRVLNGQPLQRIDEYGATLCGLLRKAAQHPLSARQWHKFNIAFSHSTGLDVNTAASVNTVFHDVYCPSL
jgi:hypothetical protein